MSPSPLRRRRQQQQQQQQQQEQESPQAGPSSSNRPAAHSRDNAKAGTQKAGQAGGIISLIDVLRVVTTIVALALALSYYLTSGDSWTFNHRPWFTHLDRLRAYIRGPLLLTPAQLSLHNGTAIHDHRNLPIYLSINGTIFDVSASPHTYGPGGSYHVFAGRDATRAFVTGCFQTDLTGDLRGVERMFIPVEDVEGDEEEGKGGGYEGVAAAQRKGGGGGGGGGGEGGIVTLTTKAQRKIRAEQERREARKRVHREVDKWLRFYREHGKYFEVGILVGGDGDAEGLAGEAKEGVRYEGEVPSLCEAAERARPKRSQLNAAAAAGGGSDGQGKKVFRTKIGEGEEKDEKPV